MSSALTTRSPASTHRGMPVALPLALAALGVLLVTSSVALAIALVRSYVRHMATGDQAGTALGMDFLNSFVIPLAALFVMGAVVSLGRPERAVGDGAFDLAAGHVLRVAGVLLQIAGALMLLFAAASVVLGFALVPVVFSLLLWASGSVLRSSGRGPRSAAGVEIRRPSSAFMFMAVMLPTSVIVALSLSLIEMYRQRGEPNAPPIVWPMVFMMYGPTLVMVGLMAILVLVYARRVRG